MQLTLGGSVGPHWDIALLFVAAIVFLACLAVCYAVRAVCYVIRFGWRVLMRRPPVPAGAPPSDPHPIAE